MWATLSLKGTWLQISDTWQWVSALIDWLPGAEHRLGKWVSCFSTEQQSVSYHPRADWGWAPDCACHIIRIFLPLKHLAQQHSHCCAIQFVLMLIHCQLWKSSQVVWLFFNRFFRVFQTSETKTKYYVCYANFQLFLSYNTVSSTKQTWQPERTLLLQKNIHESNLYGILK